MESNEPAPTGYDAAAALRDATASRGAIADRVVTPPWYHPALGLIQAALVLNLAFLKGVSSVLLTLLAVLAIGALVRVYQSRYGVWLGPDQAGPAARPLLWALASVVVVGIGLGLLTAFTGGPAWVAWVGAALAFAGTVVFGPRYDERLRAQIRSGWVPGQ